MTKLRNKLILVLLALCLVACMGIAVACGDGDADESVTYTVTVKANGEAVKGAKVTVKKGNASFGSKNTGNDGKVTFKLAKDNYTVVLDNLPDGFEAPAGALTFPSNRNLTVNLVEGFAYKVKLVKEDGSPFYVAGVSVGICTLAGNCLDLVEIDANGLARIEAPKNDYHIQIKNLPAGYAFECDEHDYSIRMNEEGNYYWDDEADLYNLLTEDVTEMTVKIYPVEVLDFANMTKLTDAQIAEYKANKGLDVDGGAAYSVSVNVPAGGAKYYSFTSEYDDNYTMYLVDYMMFSQGYYMNQLFRVGENGDFIYNDHGQAVETEKNKKYYINVVNTGEEAQDMEFIIATPYASNIQAYDKGEYEVTLYGEKTSATILFVPDQGGAVFKATVLGDDNAAIKTYNQADDAKYMWRNLQATDYTEGSNVSFKYTAKMTDSVYLGISVKAATYPVTVTVKIEKTNDLTDTYDKPTVQGTLTKYNRPDNKDFIPVPMDSTANPVLGADNYYHMGADGPVIMVKLVGKLDTDRLNVFGGAPLVYIDRATGFFTDPYIIDVTTAQDKADLTKGNSYKDYRKLLRGFEEYDQSEDGSYNIPSNLTGEYYVKYANEDGAYPLNAQLMAVLKDMAGQLTDILPNVSKEYQWLFACYYYADYVEPDVIVGAYDFAERTDEFGETSKVGDEKPMWQGGGVVSAVEYRLEIEKRGKFVIYRLGFGYEVELEGTWTKVGDNYTFTVPNGALDENWDPIDLVMTATYNNGKITLTGEDGYKWIFNRDVVTLGSYETEDGKAKLEMYEDFVKFYVKNGDDWVLQVYSEYVMDQPNTEIQLTVLYKNSDIENVKAETVIQGAKMICKVTITDVFDNPTVYEFDISALMQA
ncbi:MAG: hypothetical protein J1F69_05270 [Clostridiales bacterium]|nr:hypothetical protein [Clostridiales bacterium]